MKRSINILSVIAISIMLSSCSSSKIKGLWVVERVHAGSTETAPSARWIRFQSDKQQEGGNGWQKHTVGTWKLKGKKLTIVNTNGFIDKNDPFQVKFVKKKMEWTRREKEQRVKIYLRRIENIELAPRDELLGLWSLKTILEDGQNVTLKHNPRSRAYIQIKWDNTFVFDDGSDTHKSGIYRVDGNRNEMELYFNNVECDRRVFDFQIENKRLVLTSVNGEKEEIAEYIKLDDFPK